MDSSTSNLSQKTPEEIRSEIASTRESMSENLHALESDVRSGVQKAKDNLSLSTHVRRQPTGAFLGAVGVGFLLGNALMTRNSRREERNGRHVRRAVRGLLDEEVRGAIKTIAQAVMLEMLPGLSPALKPPLQLLYKRLSGQDAPPALARRMVPLRVQL